MPRRVDHAQRRQAIAKAVWAVIATHGIDAVSLREVAAEAGMSVGQVQHYFASKDAMILHACRALAETAFDRAVPTRSAVGRHRRGMVSSRDLVRNVLLAGIPADERNRLAANVWFTFVTKSPTWPALAAVVREQWTGARRFLEAVLRDAAAERGLRTGVDPSREATALLALADGLVLRAVVGAVKRATAVKVVDRRLDEIFS